MKLAKWLAVATIGLCPMLGHADDWPCEVILCLSNPAGATAVSQCVPPITKLWRELAKGHAFPTCAMNTSEANGNSARNDWANPSNCPPPYGYYVESDVGFVCEFMGVVTVNIANKPFTRVLWNFSRSVTEDWSNGPPATTAPIPVSATSSEF